MQVIFMEIWKNETHILEKMVTHDRVMIKEECLKSVNIVMEIIRCNV